MKEAFRVSKTRIIQASFKEWIGQRCLYDLLPECIHVVTPRHEALLAFLFGLSCLASRNSLTARLRSRGSSFVIRYQNARTAFS
jgi:hypothetical protein